MGYRGLIYPTSLFGQLSEPSGSDFILKYSNPKVDGETTYGYLLVLHASCAQPSCPPVLLPSFVFHLNPLVQTFPAKADRVVVCY